MRRNPLRLRATNTKRVEAKAEAGQVINTASTDEANETTNNQLTNLPTTNALQLCAMWQLQVANRSTPNRMRIGVRTTNKNIQAPFGKSIYSS